MLRALVVFALFSIGSTSVHAEERRLYLEALGGANFVQNETESGVEFSYDVGYTVGGAVGLHTGPVGFAPNSRVELEIAYSSIDFDATAGSASATGNIDVMSYMAQAYLEGSMEGQGRPYVGIGVGYLDLDGEVTVGSTSASASDGDAGFQGMVGIRLAESGGVGLDLEYRYTDSFENAGNGIHGLVLSARFGL